MALEFPNISPEIFTVEVFGFSLALRWYALAYIVGIIIAWQIVVHMIRRPKLWPTNTPALNAEQAEDLMVWIIFGVVLGGRLGSVLFYYPSYYLANPIDALKIWDGGMAFHGGLLGVILAIILFSWRHKLPMVTVGDAVAVSVPTGLFLGRIANFINNELWGRPSDLPWAVEFPGIAAQNCPDVVGVCARHPSQLYEAMLEGMILGGVLLWLAYRKGGLKTPGAMIGVFLAGYGIARFIVEFFRQPDAQFVSPGNPLGLAFHIDGIGLTMGQTLSLPMIVLGIAIIVFSRRRA